MIEVLHICISNSNGGAAIATNRLNHLMNRSDEISSNMLVLVKHKDDDFVVALSKFKALLSRVYLLFDRLTWFYKNKEFGLFSHSFVGQDISNHNLVKNADVVYLHWINNGFLSINVINQLFEMNKKVIVFCHDMWFFTGGCHYSHGCLKYQTECNNCHFFSNKYLSNTPKHNFNRKLRIFQKHPNLAVIAPSSLWVESAKSSAIFRSTKVKHISNILDECFFVPSNSSGLKRKVLFGALGGSSNPYKGWSYFVEAINMLDDCYLSEIEVNIFGFESSKEDLAQFKCSVNSYGVLISEQEMLEVYSKNDIFVFSSVMESYGQTLHEAMACGLPSVAFPVGVVPDLIDHKVNGYIAEFKNSRDLKNGIVFLIENNVDNSLSYGARKKIEEMKGKDRIINEHLALIKEIE